MTSVSRPQRAPAPLQVRYTAHAPARATGTLAVLQHGGEGGLPLPPVDGACWEVWESAKPVTRWTEADVELASDGDLLFVSMRRPESPAARFEDLVADAYRQLHALATAHGHPHLLKVWHYFSAINAGEGDAERYKRFSVGRARALPPEGLLPAATCIGFQTAAPLVLFALAGRAPGMAIENPRQVSAYRYPRQYGPVPPSFARAMVGPSGQLLVSGTAAVVGHETRHAGDAVAQLEELATNIKALVEEVRERTGRELRAQAMKLYLRAPTDRAAIEARAAALFPDVPRLLVLGDICRRDLLVEAEAFYAPVAV